jgi:hypothetical protein
MGISCLHRDALQSMLSFLPFPELAAAARTHSDWMHAAGTMRSIQAHAALLRHNQVAALLSSPLRRHVDALGCPSVDDHTCPLDHGMTSALAIRCPHLKQLHCIFILSVAPTDAQDCVAASAAAAASAAPAANAALIAVRFPPQLRSLRLRFVLTKVPRRPKKKERLARMAEAIESIARLPALESLRVGGLCPGVSLLPLRATASLTSLQLDEISDPRWLPQPASSSLAADLRALTQLHRLYLPYASDHFARVLSPPHGFTLLESINDSSYLRLPPALLSALSSTPSLTHVAGYITHDVHSFEWLSPLRLPRLTALRLRLYHELIDLPTCSMPALTSLHLSNARDWIADTLQQLLELLPSLTHLHLNFFQGVTSLNFLRAAPLSHSLRSLHLEQIGSFFDLAIDGYRYMCAAEEMEHVHMLTNLRELAIVRFIRLTPDECTPFEQRPSPLLPLLQPFRYVE